MSTFAVTIKKILAVEPHPNADAIEIALIDGYRSIIKKGEFKAGDLIAYIPEAAVLPQWLLQKMNFWNAEKNKGMLAGTQGDRVKAVRLRGELSQGICYPVKYSEGKDNLLEPTPFNYIEVDKEAVGVAGFVVHEGLDVKDMLQITKYEAPIPVDMAGEVFNAGSELTLSFDVENWKAYPDVLQPGEPVVFTEKLHGTCTVVAILPYKDAHPEAFEERKNILVFSKGLGSKGLVFKNNETNKDNLYVRATKKLIEQIDLLQSSDNTGPDVPTFLLGETFGPGVQDLSYGKAIGLRIFAAAQGYRGSQRYRDWAVIEGELKDKFGFEPVPVLYRGPFSKEVMMEHTDGTTTLEATHIREGIVMVPQVERYDGSIGRVCLKSVSADYLVRKGGTEYT